MMNMKPAIDTTATCDQYCPDCGIQCTRIHRSTREREHNHICANSGIAGHSWKNSRWDVDNTLLKRFKTAEINFADNLRYGKYFKTHQGIVEITEGMYEACKIVVIYMQEKTPERIKASMKQIDTLKEVIKAGSADKLPAIAIESFPHYNYVADGNHRVIALWECGVRQFPAIFIEDRRMRYL
jgi:hypothetical protein